jgi:glycine cleavage system transcriptional repressor
MMNKVILSVLAEDRPGILAAISSTLYELDCNIENVSQTTLQTEFAGILIVTIPEGLSIEELQSRMQTQLQQQGLTIQAKPLDPSASVSYDPTEPFVITTRGPDSKGLVARITSILAAHEVNVTNLQAVFQGGDDPQKNVMIYEVDVPVKADPKILRKELHQAAGLLGMLISIQHRNIFETINRV